MWQLFTWAGRGGEGCVHLQHCRDLERLTVGFFLAGIIVANTVFFVCVCVWMSAWYCKSLEHNLLKNASLPNLTNKSYSGPTSRLGYFLPSSCCLEDLVWKGGTRSDVWSDLKSCLGQCQGKAVFWAVSQWFMIYLSAPYCFPPVPVESFPVAAQGEGGCRAVADSWAAFFPPALENLANSRAVQWLPSSPELRLWAGAEFSTSCARCLIFLLWTQQLPLHKHWVKTKVALNGGLPRVFLSMNYFGNLFLLGSACKAAQDTPHPLLHPGQCWDTLHHSRRNVIRGCSLVPSTLCVEPLPPWLLLPSLLNLHLSEQLGSPGVKHWGEKRLRHCWPLALPQQLSPLHTVFPSWDSEVAPSWINNSDGLIVACRLSCWLESYGVFSKHVATFVSTSSFRTTTTNYVSSLFYLFVVLCPRRELLVEGRKCNNFTAGCCLGCVHFHVSQLHWWGKQ